MTSANNGLEVANADAARYINKSESFINDCSSY